MSKNDQNNAMLNGLEAMKCKVRLNSETSRLCHCTIKHEIHMYASLEFSLALAHLMRR